MPKYAQVIEDDGVNAAIEVLGNRLRVAVLAFLAENGPSTRGQILAELAVGITTLKRALAILMEHGAVTADPPLDQAKSGQRVRYSYQQQRVTELHTLLGQAVHAQR